MFGFDTTTVDGIATLGMIFNSRIRYARHFAVDKNYMREKKELTPLKRCPWPNVEQPKMARQCAVVIVEDVVGGQVVGGSRTGGTGRTGSFQLVPTGNLC